MQWLTSVSEAVPPKMAWSWLWGSQIAVKGKKCPMFLEIFQNRSDVSRFRRDYGQWPTLPPPNFNILSLLLTSSLPSFYAIKYFSWTIIIKNRNLNGANESNSQLNTDEQAICKHIFLCILASFWKSCTFVFMP